MRAGTTLPFDALEAIVGAEHLLADDANRQLYSRDIFFWDKAPLADAIVRPASAQQVAALLRLARAQDFAVAPRGGGVSYTGGYVPARDGTVICDLSRLNTVFEINAADRHATVGAGCNWMQLHAAVAVQGLRPAMRGPISGSHATLGGTASQNTGSASMASFLSLEVVLADGRIINTGSAGVRSNASPFSRCYGPDLTGLFLGDTGVFGIKTRCTLALEPIPAGVAFASVGFDNLSALGETVGRIARSGISCQLLGMDPVKNRSATKVGVKEGLSTLAGVVKSAGSVMTGLRQAAALAVAGQSVLADVPWSLHVTVEGHDQGAAEHALDALRPLWANVGTDLAPSVPIAMRARPFSIRGILGPQGERWIPVHGIFPLSRAAAAITATQTLLERNAARLQTLHIEHSYIVTSHAACLLLEPMFYWRDEVSPLHASVLGARCEKYANQRPNPEARALVMQLRRELAELFRGLGGVHSQIGKYYEYAGNLQPDTFTALQDIKTALDPQCMLNPGNLGLKGGQSL